MTIFLFLRQNFDSNHFFTFKSLTLKIENDDEFKFDNSNRGYINGNQLMTSLPSATTSGNNLEYKLELTSGNWESWTRLTIPELGLMIEWYGGGSQYSNIYIAKENKEEIRGYC